MGVVGQLSLSCIWMFCSVQCYQICSLTHETQVYTFSVADCTHEGRAVEGKGGRIEYILNIRREIVEKRSRRESGGGAA